jgi:hypothetical protein
VDCWAHFLRFAQKTGLSAPIFWLRQKDFRFYPLRDPGAAEEKKNR